jgi:hypothetical protein
MYHYAPYARFGQVPTQRIRFIGQPPAVPLGQCIAPTGCVLRQVDANGQEIVVATVPENAYVTILETSEDRFRVRWDSRGPPAMMSGVPWLFGQEPVPAPVSAPIYEGWTERVNIALVPAPAPWGGSWPYPPAPAEWDDIVGRDARVICPQLSVRETHIYNGFFAPQRSPQLAALKRGDIVRTTGGFTREGRSLSSAAIEDAGRYQPARYPDGSIVRWIGIEVPNTKIWGLVLERCLELLPKRPKIIAPFGARRAPRPPPGPGAGGQDLCAAYENSVRLGQAQVIQRALLARCRAQNPNYVVPLVSQLVTPAPFAVTPVAAAAPVARLPLAMTIRGYPPRSW